MSSTTRTSERVDVERDGPAPFRDRERAVPALTDAVTRLLGAEVPDPVTEEAARRFSREEVAAPLHAIVTINGWNRLTVSTHMVFES